MWPLHVRTKEEYIRLIHGYIERQDKDPLVNMLGQAFEDYREEEDFTAWCAGVAYGMEVPDASTFMARFMETFPLSLHPVQVDWAESLIWEGKLDEASNEARAYLSRVHAAGLQKFLEQAALVRDGVSRAFLLLTSVYTEVGARSYSRRVIEQGMLMDLDPFWQQRFRSEMGKLEQELAHPDLHKLDSVWESFFREGKYLATVLELCEKCKLPIFAERMKVIARNFDEDKNYKVSDEEVFQMVYRTDKGAMVLA